MNARLPFPDEMQPRIAAWCERYRVPGAAVAWMHGDRAEAAAAGVTNITTGVRVTPDTLFQIGSITKVYTTTLIMQLVDEGRIDLDAPATTYLPDLRFGESPSEITVRKLLSHTSGVDGDYFEDFGRGDDALQRYVASCAQLRQISPPGAMFSYNNAAFVVLGRIVESLTGATWHAALRSRLLDPIGADHTVTLPEEALLFNTSPGHTVSPTTFEINLARPWVLPHAMAACGATPCATAGDLLKFARLHLDRGAAPDGTRILSEASVAAMQQPQVDLARGPGYGANHWGLGWMLFDWGGQRRDARVIGHDGGTIGQSSSLRILPEERFAVAVLTNSVSGSLLTNRVMRWLFDEIFGVDMPPRPMPPESPADIDLTPYVGVYERIGFRTTITLQDGHLISKTEVLAPMAENEPQFPAAQMFALEEGLFLQRDPTGVFVSVTFSDFHDGKPRYLHAGRVARRAE